jgi:hypothetical protein
VRVRETPLSPVRLLELILERQQADDDAPSRDGRRSAASRVNAPV